MCDGYHRSNGPWKYHRQVQKSQKNSNNLASLDSRTHYPNTRAFRARDSRSNRYYAYSIDWCSDAVHWCEQLPIGSSGNIPCQRGVWCGNNEHSEQANKLRIDHLQQLPHTIEHAGILEFYRFVCCNSSTYVQT